MKCLMDSMRFLFIKCLLIMFKEVEGLRKCSVGHVRQCCIISTCKKRKDRKRAVFNIFIMSLVKCILVSGHYTLVIILASLDAMHGYIAEPDNS